LTKQRHTQFLTETAYALKFDVFFFFQRKVTPQSSAKMRKLVSHKMGRSLQCIDVLLFTPPGFKIINQQGIYIIRTCKLRYLQGGDAKKSHDMGWLVSPHWTTLKKRIIQFLS